MIYVIDFIMYLYSRFEWAHSRPVAIRRLASPTKTRRALALAVHHTELSDR